MAVLAAPAAPVAPASAPKSPTAPAPAPASNGTPMDRARSRMAADAIEADLSDPDPMRTARAKAEAPKEPLKPAPAKPEDEPPAPQWEGELLEDEEATPPEPTDDKATEEPPKPAAEPLEVKGKDGKKISPWKLLDGFKARLTAAERENLELKTKLGDPKVAEANSRRLEAAEKRSQELEDEIRHVNYQKSAEFSEKYQKPYEEAWGRAVGDLVELDVLGEDGVSSRKATAQDLVTIGSMPLGEALNAAKAMFGEAANEVMAHRRELRALSAAQTKALEEARKSGADRQAKLTQLHNEVASLWEKANADASTKYDFLKSKEGDEDWNSRLAKAQTLVDKAFSESAHDPKLSAEERKAVIARHAAVRNRAIAYSSLKLENTRLRESLAAKEKELAAFAASAPANGDGKGKQAAPAASADPMERAKQRMHASAVPAPPNFY